MNFTEWTNEVEELDAAKQTAWQRYWVAGEIRHRAYFEHPDNETVIQFTRRCEEDARKNYEAAKAAYDAVLNENRANVTDSEVPAGAGESVTADVVKGIYCPYCYHLHTECTCDLCELEGHRWSLEYNVGGSTFRSCDVCGADEMTKPAPPFPSWREQIVEEQVREEEAR